MKERAKVVSLTVAVAFLILAVATPVRAQSEAAVVAAVMKVWQMIQSSGASMVSAIGAQTSSLGAAIIGAGDKQAAMTEADGNATRSMMIRQTMDQRIQNAADSFTVPDNACANSAAGGMLQVSSAAAGGGGNYRAGGVRAGNASVNQAVNSPNLDPTADARRATTVHAMYCDSEDYASYGGSKLCPSISQMPGGDKRMDSLITGAGPDGKDPDMTFSGDQIDAARMYAQNSTKRAISRELSKGEASSPAGQEYNGLMTQYEALIDAAGFPQRQEIADHTPNKATQTLLNDTLQAPSAQAYFNSTASAYAQANKVMSYAELEKFDVGRRYANTDYEQDLMSMSGDNLTRELIRVEALNAWIALETKSKIEQQSVIEGMILASMAHQEYAPLLQGKLQQLNASMGRSQ